MSAGVLDAKQFQQYPPRARALAEANLPLLRQLPVPFAAVLLRELISYDWHFPAEQQDLDKQLRLLNAMSPAELTQTMAAFQAISLPPELTSFPWAARPNDFLEKLTAFLWSAHAIDAFHEAAKGYGAVLDRANPTTEPRRLCIVIVGRGAPATSRQLFARLQPHGTLFTQLNGEEGLTQLLATVRARAQAQPAPYAHWYVDGDAIEDSSAAQNAGMVTVSYRALAPVRSLLLQKIQTERSTANVGPEQLRSFLAELDPQKLGDVQFGRDEILRRFQLSLLTEGSGTQIFSTTFVQWAGREILRRARPQTLLLRYAPRQTDRPMDDLLLGNEASHSDDPEGSLVDAEMGALYTWINLSRISSEDKATFVAWFEEGTQAVVIAPGMPRATVSTQPCTMKQMLQWIA